MKIICGYCKKEFEKKWISPKNKYNFCSKDCKHKFHSIWMKEKRAIDSKNAIATYTCSNCGKEIEDYINYAKNKEHHFCNYECKGLWQKEHMKGCAPFFVGKREKNPCYIDGRRCEQQYCIELNCNNPVSGPNKRCKDCGHKGSHNGRWKGGKILVSCDYCGKIKQISRKELILKHHFCDLEHRRLWVIENKILAKENNPFFNKSHSEEFCKRQSLNKGGTGIPYENSAYPAEWTEKLREQIRHRDNHICQYCGMTQEEHVAIYERKLDVHHIDYNKQNCDPKNLLSLCFQCHKETLYNKDYWQTYYTKLIQDKYSIK